MKESPSSSSDSPEASPSSEWLPESDLTLSNRNIHIFTTAALPWRTGTSINALLRALYILKEKKRQGDEGQVHLVLPWLDGTRSFEHRVKLYGRDVITLNGKDGQQQQSDWIRSYASHVCGMHGTVTYA
jgi:digalactosyldiacylglycerol synthase